MKKNYHPISTSLPLDEADVFRAHCKKVRRSESWVAREAIRAFMELGAFDDIKTT